MERDEAYANAAKALKEASKANERGLSKKARDWLAVAEEWRLLGNDIRGGDVGFTRRNI